MPTQVPRSTASEFAFHPSDGVGERARLTHFIRAAGLQDYDQLLERSRTEPEWFWDFLIRYFELRFAQPYDRVLDVSRGLPWPRWFVGGQTNIVLSCLDRQIESGHGDTALFTWHAEDGFVRSWTLNDLAQQTNRCANALLALGVGRGDRIGIFLPPLPEAAAAFFGIAKIGAIAVPLFSGLGGAAIADRLADVGANVVITADGTRRRGRTVLMKAVIDEAIEHLPQIKSVLVITEVGLAGARQSQRDHDWTDLLEKASAEAPTVMVPADETVMISYTSGTTGKPKGTVHTHAGLLAKVALDYGLILDLQRNDVMNWPSDPGWLGGTTRTIASTLFGTCNLLIQGAPDYPQPDRLFRLCERQHVTVLGVSPTLVRGWMRLGNLAKGHDLGNLRYIATTGEPIDEDSWWWLFEHLGQRRIPIMNMAGGTETGGSILGTTLLHPLKPCAVAAAIPGMAADVVDDYGQPVNAGASGELVMRYPSIGLTRSLYGDDARYIQNYWSRFPGMWHHGDRVSRDRDGNWFVHGRSDESIKVAGKRIASAEVEGLLLKSGRVLEAAVVGIPDALKGSALVCVCVPNDPATADHALASELIRCVAKGAGQAFRPKRILFVNDLPKTSSLKIMRRVIQAVLTSIPLDDVSALHNHDAVEQLRRAMALEENP